MRLCNCSHGEIQGKIFHKPGFISHLREFLFTWKFQTNKKLLLKENFDISQTKAYYQKRGGVKLHYVYIFVCVRTVYAGLHNFTTLSPAGCSKRSLVYIFTGKLQHHNFIASNGFEIKFGHSNTLIQMFNCDKKNYRSFRVIL